MRKTFPQAPTLVQRKNGGWLAISAKSEPLKIGVTADTQNAAAALLAKRLAEWEQQKDDCAMVPG